MRWLFWLFLYQVSIFEAAGKVRSHSWLWTRYTKTFVSGWKRTLKYNVFHGFWQAYLIKVQNGGLVLGSIQFVFLLQLPQKNEARFKSGRNDSKNRLVLLIKRPDTHCMTHVTEQLMIFFEYRIYSRLSRPAYKSNWKNIQKKLVQNSYIF